MNKNNIIHKMNTLLLPRAFFTTDQEKLKKFRKKLVDDRKGQLKNIKQKFTDIADEETKRAKKLFDDHKEFFKPEKETTTSIDFYEK